MSDPAGELLIWTISDGRAGIDNQVLGLAEAIAEMIPCKIKSFLAPRTSLLSLLTANRPLPGMEDGWPKLLICCGQSSLPYAKAMRKWSNGQTFCIQLQAPRRPLKQFDMVIAPNHDQLDGENVLSIIGATNRISKSRLAKARETFAEQINQLPCPRLAVVIGGNSKRHKLTKEKFKELRLHLERLAKTNVSLMITTSRRTPGFAKRALRRRLGKRENVWLWTGAKKDGDNPYMAFLDAASAVIVTSDSTNMLTDGASAGKPVLMFRLDGEDGKFSDLHDELAAKNLVHPFTGSLATWDVEPLAETRRAAEEVLRRFYGHLKPDPEAFHRA